MKFSLSDRQYNNSSEVQETVNHPIGDKRLVTVTIRGGIRYFLGGSFRSNVLGDNYFRGFRREIELGGMKQGNY